MARLITFEGIDGSGKSTLIENIRQYLSARNIPVFITSEPSTDILLNIIKDNHLCSEANLALFLADRAEHVTKVIEPLMPSNMIILCDRFTDSTIAYQHGAGSIDLNSLLVLNKFFSHGIVPDRTYYCRCQVNNAIARIAMRKGKEPDMYDKKSYSFFANVETGYEKARTLDKARFCTLNANKDAEKLFHECVLDLDKYLKEWGYLN